MATPRRPASGSMTVPSLREIARRQRNMFFGHVLVPHPPFSSRRRQRRSLAEATRASRRDNYVNQVRYVNTEILRLVDAIRAGPRPAVILVHADEGPWPIPYAGDERFLGTDTSAVDWTRVGEVELREKLGILMAVSAGERAGPGACAVTSTDPPSQPFGGTCRTGRTPLLVGKQGLYRSRTPPCAPGRQARPRGGRLPNAPRQQLGLRSAPGDEADEQPGPGRFRRRPSAPESGLR